MESTDRSPAIFISGVVALIYAVIVFMAMSSSGIFRPKMGGGEHAAIASTVAPIFWMMLLSIIHERVQNWFTSNRPAASTPALSIFDLITSFAPVIAAVIAVLYLFASRPDRGYANWFLMLQASYGMMIFLAIRHDIMPTIRHYQASAPAAPVAPPHP